MAEQESQEALAEYDETQSRLNIKLEGGLQLGWGWGSWREREMPGLGREKF